MDNPEIWKYPLFVLHSTLKTRQILLVMLFVTKQQGSLYNRRKQLLFSGSTQTQKGIIIIEWEVITELENVQSTSNHHVTSVTHITKTNVL